MVKLIMTDIDGTLMQEGGACLDPEYYSVIRQLTERGIHFAVASGRHSVSVRRNFGPVLDCIWIVSQNGSVLEYQGKSMVTQPIPPEWAREFWKDLAACPPLDGIIDTADWSCAPFENTEMFRIVRDEYKFNIFATGSWDVIPEGSYSMMTIFHPENAEAFYKQTPLPAKWESRMDIISTGQYWIDCMMPGVSKGQALERLCGQLGISPSETIAFGDNLNDIPMLRAAGCGYAVDTARAEVLEAADKIIPGYRSNGVLEVLKKLL